MAYFFRVMTKEKIFDKVIENHLDFRVGSTDGCDFNLKGTPFADISLLVERRGQRWHLTSEQPIWIGRDEYHQADVKTDSVFLLLEKPLTAGVIFQKRSDLGDAFQITKRQITIGRSRCNDLVFNNMRVSEEHARITYQGNFYTVSDCGSLNGTFLNGKRIQSKLLQNGDIITIDRYSIVYRDNRFYFNNIGDDLVIRGGLCADESDLNAEYPLFRRSPRLRLVPPNAKVEIQSPPPQETKQTVNWLQVLLMPVVMIGVALIIMFTMGGSTGWLMIPMSLCGAIAAVSSYFTQKKKFQKNSELRVKRYTEYLGKAEEELQEIAQKQHDALEDAHPSCEECAEIIIQRKRRLWERLIQDDDFMRLRLGAGSEQIAAEIACPKKNVTLVDDELEQKAWDLAAQYRSVTGIPITVDFKKQTTCGIIGARPDTVNLAKNLILQAVTHHSYEDLTVVVIAPEDEKDLWADTRWLPHINSEYTGDLRCIACADDEKSNLIHILEDYLEQRARTLKDSNGVQSAAGICSSFILFVLADAESMQKSLLLKYLMQNDMQMGVSALLLFDTMYALPKDCLSIIEISGVHGAYYERWSANIQTTFETEKIEDAAFEMSMRALAPVRIEKSAEENSLPTCISFLDGMKVHTPDELPILKNWQNARIDKSLSAPIGIRANGDRYTFDIHEKASGPNGLVAGMPGSGKTEMIQTWILSMACCYSPEDISFILIDFKGSGLILPLQGLPHIAGTISDLDFSIKRNLIALGHEIERRESLMRENGIHDFKEYLRQYYQNNITEKLGFLFIIVDEYAEFRAQFPESTELMDSLMRRGRGLGMYVILMSQRIIGVASSTAEATAQFRWCLKVAGASESREMIQIPDAASIKNPGRVFIRANEKTDVIQSFWSNAPYNPTRKTNAIPKVRIGAVQLSGRRMYFEDWEKTVGFRSELTEINVVIKELNRVTNEGGFSRSNRVWIAKLPKQVYLSKLLQVAFDGTNWSIRQSNELQPVIGLIDDPSRQSQYPLMLDFVAEGHLAVYGAPGTGKTTFLQTLIMSLALQYSPDEVSIYGMDFGGWSLMMFRDLPHVGGIVLNDDADSIEKLTEMIQQELAERKHLFAEKGVGSVVSYREAEGRLPYIVLVVDNFAPVLGLYPDLDTFFITLTREGGSYGIYLAATANAANAIPYRMAQNIRNSVALQMSDRSDYSQIVGRTEGMEPEKNVGRGLVRTEQVLEFQTALPADGASERERAQNIKQTVLLMNEKWDGEHARLIPLMPECIYFEEGKEEEYRVGLSAETLNWMHVDFQTLHYLAISGTKGAGKTNFLAVLGRAFCKKENGEMVLMDVNGTVGESLRNAANRYLVRPEEIDAYMNELKDELELRKAALSEGRCSEFAKILVLIDDYSSFFRVVSKATISRLEALLRIGKGYDVFAAISIEASDLVDMKSQGERVAYHLLANAPNAVLLGGSCKDHSAVQTDIPFIDQGQPLGPMEGYFVRNKKATRLKAMFEYKKGESVWTRSV